MTHIIGLRCSVCASQFPYHEQSVIYTCSRCPDLRAVLDFSYDYKIIQTQFLADRKRRVQPTGLWRYRAFLPILHSRTSDLEYLNEFFGEALTVGNTPLVRCRSLEALHGQRQVWIKDEGRNPSASFKDRASAMVAAHATLLKNPSVIATASTGNAAAALCAIAAHMRQRVVIFVPG